MDSKTLEHLLEKRVKAIGEEAAAIPPDFFPETIHRFRTETKKLMALLRLAGMEMHDEPKLPKAFRDLYHAAGDMRDYQMQLEFVTRDKRHTIPAFTIWLAHQAYSHMGVWKHKHVQKVLDRLQDYIRALKLPDLDIAALHGYFTDHLSHMKVLITGSADDEALHEIRREVKDMQNVLSYCKKEWVEGFAAFAHLEQGLEELSQKAGVYNDRRNLLSMLDAFQEDYSKELDEKEILAVMNARSNWEGARMRERKALIVKIRGLVR